MGDELVLEIWNNSQMDDPEKINFILNIINSINYNSKSFIEDMKESLHDICIKNELCPECGEKLRLINAYEIHSEVNEDREYQGYLICDNCGYSNEKE